MNGWLIDFLKQNPEIKEVSVQKWASYIHPEKALAMISIGIRNSDTGVLRFAKKRVDFETLTDDDKLLDLLYETLEENKNGYERDSETLAKWSDQNG